MEGAAELEAHPENSIPEDCEPEPALEVGLASRIACSEATLENSSDPQSGVSSSPSPTPTPTPTPTPSPSPSPSAPPAPALTETDLSLCVAGQLESSHDGSDGQQDLRESAQEVASASPKDLIQVDKNDIEVISSLLKLQERVRELELEVQKAKDWAEQTVTRATQTGRKERQELNALRAERKALEESTQKKKTELETALGKSSEEVQRLKHERIEMQKLKNENAKLRAELAAAKLSAAESIATYQEAAKREKKGVKRAQGWEKEKAKLQEELSEEKRKLTQLQQVLAQAKERHLQAEVRWRQEEKAKEEAVARADKEKRAKEQAEAAFKRREDATRRKADQDKQRLRDDVERLTQELSSLRAAESANLVTASWNSPVTTVGMMGGRFGLNEKEHWKDHERLARVVAEVVTTVDMLKGKFGLNEEHAKGHERLARDLVALQGLLCRALPRDLLRDLPRDFPGDLPRERECVMCMCEEMAVVFLPCAHQVVCIECNELHQKQGMRDCPSCRTPIQQRIRVYGPSC